MRRILALAFFIFVFIPNLYSENKPQLSLKEIINKTKDKVQSLNPKQNDFISTLKENNLYVKINNIDYEIEFLVTENKTKNETNSFFVYNGFKQIESGYYKFSGFGKKNIEAATYAGRKTYFFEFDKKLNKIILNIIPQHFKIDSEITLITKDIALANRKKLEQNFLVEEEKKRVQEAKLAKERALKEAEQEKLKAKKEEEEKAKIYEQVKSTYGAKCEKSFFNKNGFEIDSDDYKKCINELIELENKNKQILVKKKEDELKLQKEKEEKKKKRLVVHLELNTINKEMIADIGTKPSDIEFITLEKNFNSELINNHIKDYKEVLVYLKKDFIVNSASINTSSNRSSYLSGTISKPNMEFDNIQREINNQRNLMNKIEREYEYKRSLSQRDCGPALTPAHPNYGYYYGCVMGKPLIIAEANSLASQYRKVERNVEMLENRLRNTDQIIYEDKFTQYSYSVEHIKGEKKAKYILFILNENEVKKSEFEIDETKDFYLVSNIHPQDNDKLSIESRHNTFNDIKNWEGTKMDKVNFDTFFNIASRNIVPSDNENFYSDLNIKQDSFFASIFKSNPKDNNNIFSSTPQKESLDTRFVSIVKIESQKSKGKIAGTGFYIDGNKILTNFHVIDGVSSIIISNAKGQKTSAKILKTDFRRDLALLETNLKGQPVNFYSGDIKQGLEVEALGHPAGLDFSISRGIVSAVRLDSSTYNVTGNKNTKFIQTDAAINPGNSGGPLYFRNFVIGINTQGLKKSETEGLNFAVHLDEIKSFLN